MTIWFIILNLWVLLSICNHAFQTLIFITKEAILEYFSNKNDLLSCIPFYKQHIAFKYGDLGNVFSRMWNKYVKHPCNNDHKKTLEDGNIKAISLFPLVLIQVIPMTKQNNILMHAFFMIGFFVLILAFLALCFVTVSLLLDKLHRPAATQLPFNILLDRIIPLIVLVLPSILIFSLSFPASTELITKFGYIIIIHAILIVPLFYYWSKHRSWVSSTQKHRVTSWNQPILFLHIALGIIYPATWGLYFTIIRYLRLSDNGIIIDPSSNMIEVMIVLFFLLPHLILWVLPILQGIQQLKDLNWAYIETVLFSLHISLLRFHYYFSFCWWMHKISFIIYNFVSLVAPVNSYLFYINKKDFPLYRRVIHKLFCYPFICILIVFTIIIIEIIITQRIYYGLYLLFIYPIISSILRNLIDFTSLSFVEHVCLVDYMLLKTTNIRFPYHFYFFLNNNMAHYGVTMDIPPDVFNTWEKGYGHACTYYAKYRIEFSNKLLKRVSGVTINQYFQPIPSSIYSKQAYCKRVKVAYLDTYNVRWYHTTRVLCSPLSTIMTKGIHNKMHPIILRLASSPIDHLALMDSNIPFHIIQKNTDQLNKNYVLPDFFTPNNKIIIPKTTKHFIDIIETSQVHMFQPLTEKNVVIGTVKEMRVIYPKENFASMQQNPDVAIQLSNSTLLNKESLGIDYKNIMGTTKFSNRNQVSVGDKHNYFTGLTEYVNFLSKKHPENHSQMMFIIEQLRNAVKSGSFNKQLEVWSENLHHFPLRGKPPLWWDKNLCTDTLAPTIRLQVTERKQFFRAMSQKAYELNIPEDNFDQSHVQLLMRFSEEVSQTIDISLIPIPMEVD